MNAYIVITIDVEPDCTSTWRYSEPLAFRGVSKGIHEKLQPLFNKYGIKPTYLINNVVLENQQSIKVLSNLEGDYELGTHLHPEFIEPEKTFDNYEGKRGLANCCHYPPEIEFEKIKNITKLFFDSFGYNPTCFRAGRFSAGSNTISSLAKLGYKVDTSVTPHIKWSDHTRENPVDFTDAKEQPYFIKEGTILDSDEKGLILQVPVSISEKKANLAVEVMKSFFGLRRGIRKAIPVWLRPVYSSNNDFIRLTENYFRRYRHEKFIVFNMMFHNVEVMPNLSPYSKSDSDCDAYLTQLELFFRYCAERNIKSVDLSEVYDLYRTK